jgi:glycosyltransferase involved in cell wall biosynthesis
MNTNQMRNGPALIRVLVLAEAANPEWVSVPLVGWSHAEALSRHADVHVATQVRNREAILRTGWREGVEFTAIDNESSARALWKASELVRGGSGKGWTTVTALSAIPYYHFEYLVWQRFRKDLLAGKFDIVHRLTPLSPTTPSLLASRCRRAGVPFVLGPLNGGVPWPKEFRDAQHQEREWLAYVRDAYKLLPAYRSTRDDAAAIVVGSQATYAQLSARYRDRAVYLPENAVDPARFPCVERPSPRKPLRVIFVGRLVPYKGADILIEAMAPLLSQSRLELEVVGDGPEMPKLRRLLGELGLQDRVRLAGWVPHTELHEKMAQADIFAFPSVREFGGGAVLEAMAMGLVPVVADYAGPRELVSDETGIRVRMGRRDELVAGFRRALEQLADRPDLVHTTGQRARQRVLELFTWDAKARQMREVYRWVLGARAKPDFGMAFPKCKAPRGGEAMAPRETAKLSGT